MFELYKTTHETDGRRVRWVYDSDYRSEGSFALDMPENVVACAAEQEGLARGDLVALGAVVETRCGDCGTWIVGDSLYGIVVDVEADLTMLGDTLLDLDPEVPNLLEALDSLVACVEGTEADALVSEADPVMVLARKALAQARQG